MCYVQEEEVRRLRALRRIGVLGTLCFVCAGDGCLFVLVSCEQHALNCVFRLHVCSLKFKSSRNFERKARVHEKKREKLGKFQL